jgi:selenoprotein W-related protein
MPATGGVFEVFYNNDLIFSKKQEGRFPEPGEVEHMLMHAIEGHPPLPSEMPEEAGRAAGS